MQIVISEDLRLKSTKRRKIHLVNIGLHELYIECLMGKTVDKPQHV